MFSTYNQHTESVETQYYTTLESLAKGWGKTNRQKRKTERDAKVESADILLLKGY